MDVEDYYQVEAFSDIVSRQQWGSYSSRVENNTLRVLDLFDACGVKGTYFILGWVAERHPGLVKEIARRGHEIGCHSYWHPCHSGFAFSSFAQPARDANGAARARASRARPRIRRP